MPEDYVPRSASLWVSCPGCKAHMRLEPKLIDKLREEAKAHGKTVHEVAIAYFDHYHLSGHRRETHPDVN